MFTRLLVPLDGSPFAEQALGQAAAIARASEAALDLVFVHEPQATRGRRDPAGDAAQWKVEEAYLKSIADELVTGAGVAIKLAVLNGDGGGVAHAISSRARDVEADLIVMTSHGRTGLSRAWLGSVADGVVRHSLAPVLMVRPADGNADHPAAPRPLRRVLVPLDGSENASMALASASALAACSAASLILVRVVPPVSMATIDVDMSRSYAYSAAIDQASTQSEVDAAKQELSDLARSISGGGRPSVEVYVIVANHVAQALLDFARAHDADVIAMSVYGRGASRLLVGSIPDKVLRASELPILLYRPLTVPATAEALTHAAPLEEAIDELVHGACR